ncbi:MAG: hypothetical protein M0Z85_12825 [Gammaproteobacteria bacterium]|nr:hypothetical protein [Gammaproteobacteria bacterium]
MKTFSKIALVALVFGVLPMAHAAKPISNAAREYKAYSRLRRLSSVMEACQVLGVRISYAKFSAAADVILKAGEPHAAR